MARPNNQGALEAHIRGLREAKAAFQRVPEVFREKLAAATETTVREIARQARARVIASPSVRTGALRDHISWSMNQKSGRGRAGVTSGTTTFVSAGVKVKIKGIYRKTAGGWDPQKIQPTRYAHLIEFGSRQAPAEPFMLPAAEAQKSPYLDRVRAAGKDAERDLSIGRTV